MPWYEFNCKICGKQVKTYRGPKQVPPKYCSHPCRYKGQVGRLTKPRITVHCLSCGKPMEYTKAEIAEGRGRFCSRSCGTSYTRTGTFHSEITKRRISESNKQAHAHQRRRVQLTCKWCGASYERVPSQLNRTSFCSAHCRGESKRGITGKDHPSYKSRTAKTCVICGKTVLVIPSKLERFKCCSKNCVGVYSSLLQYNQHGPNSLERYLMTKFQDHQLEFRTQYKIGRWLVDFAFPEHKLAIEADGIYWHTQAKNKERDSRKDSDLQKLGWIILRFTDDEIYQSSTICIDKVLKIITN